MILLIAVARAVFAITWDFVVIFLVGFVDKLGQCAAERMAEKSEPEEWSRTE